MRIAFCILGSISRNATIQPRKSSSLPQRRKVRKEFRWLTNTMLSPFRLELFSNHRADFLSVLGVFAVQLPFLGSVYKIR